MTALDRAQVEQLVERITKEVMIALNTQGASGQSGPAICGDCYEVPAEMAADVEKHVPGSACKTRRGTSGLDLRAGLWRQLADLGVGKIGVDPRCTNEDKTLFSYRRDGTTGRIAGITWIEA